MSRKVANIPLELEKIAGSWIMLTGLSWVPHALETSFMLWPFWPPWLECGLWLCLNDGKCMLKNYYFSLGAPE